MQFVQLTNGTDKVGPQPSESGLQTLDSLLASDWRLRAAAPVVPVRAKPQTLPLKEFLGEAQTGLVQHSRASQGIAKLGAALHDNHAASADDLRKLVAAFMDRLKLDPDLLALIAGMQTQEDGKGETEYLFDHAVNVSLLSMSTASRLGWSCEDVTVIGLGSLFQDVGMLGLANDVRLAPRALTDREWLEIRRHPLVTLERIEHVRGLPGAARFIAYQAHERHDGTGYPRGRSGTNIHPFARIVGVVDTFVAMTHARPYRPALSGYDAIKTILRDTSQGRFDGRVVRALLDCVSAFPIGSMVELHKGVVGRVIRANPGFHTRPVVIEIEPDGEVTDWVIDLAKEKRARIVRVLPSEDAATASA